MSVLMSFRSAFVSKTLTKSCCFISKANIQTTRAAYLYSPAAIGIDNYTHTRERIATQFTNVKEKFLAKMQEFVEDDPKNMIFTEDLKNMVHIAEKKDLELTLKMIKKFNNQASEYRFGSFIFGPVIMRMFHYLDVPEEALQCFQESKNSGFFDQQVSFQILLDLLYRHERYDDMYQVFEVVKQRQLNMTKYPKYAVILIMAACYKQNTPASLEYASKLWTEMNDIGSVPLRRACTFFAGLALNQGAPHIALEVITSHKQHYITIRNIKAIALAQMGRVDDAMPVLRGVLDIDVPSQKDKHTFFSETIEKVKHAVMQSNNKDVQKEFENIEKALRERNLIDDQRLDQLLNQQIEASRPPQDQNRVRLHASYQANRRVPIGSRRDRGDAY